MILLPTEHPSEMDVRHSGLGTALLVCGFALAQSCGGGSGSKSEAFFDICGCVPDSPASADHRHAEKHVPLPGGTPGTITVATILGWAVDSSLLPDTAPRAGRELQLFEVAHAFVQAVRIEPNDCDLHMEIADTADKTAPRVIVETPVDAEYCTARQMTQQQLAAHGIDVGNEVPGAPPQELNPPIPADVVGLAFEDFPHNNRGTATVATIWELHPAVVKLLQ